MDAITALHTAARRYLLKRAPMFDPAMWEREYRDTLWVAEIDDATRHALLGTYVQYEVIGELLYWLEEKLPQDFLSVDALRDYLLEAGSTPIDPLHGEWDEEQRREEAGERARFVAVVQGLTNESLQEIEPLPLRRAIGTEESERLWRRLRRKWGIGERNMWYPMVDEGAPPPGVLAFHNRDFREHVPLEALRGWLRERRARPVLQLGWGGGAMGGEYEMDLACFVPMGSEVYWTSAKMVWLMYSSHEYSITVGGEWLLNLIKRAWPECEQHRRTKHLPFDATPSSELVIEGDELEGDGGAPDASHSGAAPVSVSERLEAGE